MNRCGFHPEFEFDIHYVLNLDICNRMGVIRAQIAIIHGFRIMGGVVSLAMTVLTNIKMSDFQKI